MKVKINYELMVKNRKRFVNSEIIKVISAFRDCELDAFQHENGLYILKYKNVILYYLFEGSDLIIV